MAATRHWATLDFDGEPIRYFDYPAEGSVQWPPAPQTLSADDPEWDNPLF